MSLIILSMYIGAHCTKTSNGSFVKLKTTLTAAKKWQPSLDGSLTQIIKRCKLCTHHSDIIDTEVTHFNDVVQVETIDSVEKSPGHILSRPCKCGHQRPHDQSFPYNFKSRNEYKTSLCKTGLREPPTPPEQIGEGDHNFYKEKKGGTLKK